MESIFLYLQEVKDSEYSIKIGRSGGYLCTPGGQTIKSPNKLLMEHIISELQAFQEIDIEDNAILGEPLNFITSYSLICTEIDFVFGEPRRSIEIVDENLSSDPIRQLSPGPEKIDQIYQWRKAIDYLKENGIDFYKIQYYDNEDSDKLTKFCKSKFDSFNDHQVSVFNNLYHIFGSAISSIAFADGKLKPNELATLLMEAGGRSSAEMDDEEDFKSKFRNIFDEIRDVGIRCEAYLNFNNEYKTPEEELVLEIKKGETSTLEFKSTFRHNLHSGKNDEEITFSCLKTIAAFLNTDGGRLMIGISDEGEVIGIEKDGFFNIDKFQLHLFNLIKDCLGSSVAPLINLEIVMVNGENVCLVNCKKGSNPVYLKFKKKDEAYFIRTGPGTTKLSTSEAHSYIKDHFE
jgi:hypothetical protein